MEKEIDQPASIGGTYCRTLPEPGEILAENDEIVLRAFSEKDRQNYLEISKEYSCLKHYYSDPRFLEVIWKECLSDTSAYYAVIRKKRDDFIGYCAIKDISKYDWEAGIELDRKFVSHGYGYQAMSLMLKRIYELTGRSNFISLVDADNYRSQALMKKLGGKPDGIQEFMLHSEELEQFENDNLSLIDDKMREIADEFGVEPRKLLSHVLVYRFDMLGA